MPTDDTARTCQKDSFSSELEAVKCYCGADDCSVVLDKVPSGRLVKCNACGMHYSNPRLLQRMIKDAAGGEQYQDVDEDKVKEPARWDKTFSFRMKILNKHCPKKGKFLDVGCYAGFLLKLAKDEGWDTCGVEPTIGGVRYANEKLGLDVKHGTLEEAGYESGFFDALGLFEVIEHVPDPSIVIKEANRVLKPGGMIFVETPTVDNWAAKILKGKWRHFIASHFWFFSEKTLKSLLVSQGFEPVETIYIGRYTSIRHAIAVLSRHFKPLAVVLDLLLVKLLRLGGSTVYVNLRDNFLVVARKKA